MKTGWMPSAAGPNASSAWLIAIKSAAHTSGQKVYPKYTTISLPRNSLSLRCRPVWSVSVNGPPTVPRPYIRSSIICAADCCSSAAAFPPPKRHAINNSAHALEASMSLGRSDAEADAGAGGCRQNLARHLPLRFLGEIQPAAMHGNQHVRVQLADLGDDLGEIVRRRRPQMKAAQDGAH